MYPNDTAACLAQLVPSVELLPVLDVLTPVMLEVDGQIDALVAVQRHIGMLQARETELLASLDASDTTKDGFTRDMVAAAVRVPPGRMRGQMAIASDLTNRLPTLWTCCGRGRSVRGMRRSWLTPPAPSPPRPLRSWRLGCWSGRRSRPSPSSGRR